MTSFHCPLFQSRAVMKYSLCLRTASHSHSSCDVTLWTWRPTLIESSLWPEDGWGQHCGNVVYSDCVTCWLDGKNSWMVSSPVCETSAELLLTFNCLVLVWCEDCKTRRLQSKRMCTESLPAIHSDQHTVHTYAYFLEFLHKTCLCSVVDTP